MGFLSRLAERRAVVDPAHPRDPGLATLFGLGAATSSGVNVTPANARECPEVDAAISLNEDTLATVPLDLFERTGDDTRERATGHPLHTLLHDRPNGWQTSAEFRQMMEGWRETHGNAYARIVPGAAGPMALEPVHPDTVRPFRTSSGGVAYRWRPDGGGQARTLLGDEMLHLRDHPFARDMITGSSRVDRHRELIGRALATGQYLSRFFSNGAVPKTFLKTESKLDADQRRELLEQFEARHGGLANHHRVGLLQGGLDVEQLGIDNEKAQVVENYKLIVTQIAGVWQVPPHLIGAVDASTSWGTGIEQQSIGFIVYYMRPKFVVWEQALNATLMSADMRRRYYFEFNVDGLLRGDLKSRMDAFGVMVQWGIASPNELRRMLNLPPAAGGDEILAPLNMAPASQIMDVHLKSVASGGGERDLAPPALRNGHDREGLPQ